MSTFRLHARAALACATLLFPPLALSHVALDVPQAPIGQRYKAVFHVGHGCAGSATVRLRVQIPAGVVGVDPQPKPGWDLKITQGDYDKPYTLNGASVTSGTTEVDWLGGHLPSHQADTFVLWMYPAQGLTPGSTLYFPVVQECEKGVNRWIDRPAEGSKPGADDHASFPAPGLRLLPAVK